VVLCGSRHHGLDVRRTGPPNSHSTNVPARLGGPRFSWRLLGDVAGDNWNVLLSGDRGVAWRTQGSSHRVRGDRRGRIPTGRVHRSRPKRRDRIRRRQISVPLSLRVWPMERLGARRAPCPSWGVVPHTTASYNLTAPDMGRESPGSPTDRAYGKGRGYQPVLSSHGSAGVGSEHTRPRPA